MPKAKNVLFIMFDQFRWDYLSCGGHPHLQTPHLDKLAARGVRFTNARIQSPLCGPSRMSTYTGRYVRSHGATWNKVPLKVGEMTLGDHLRSQGMDCWLVGKTHMAADTAGLQRLSIDPASTVGARLSECGFDVFERDDGLRPEGPLGMYDDRGALRYNAYLRSKGYDSDNPWHDFANSGIDDAGNVLSGWFLNNSAEAANIREEDSETPYMTRRGMEFIAAQGDTPWCCHLSLIKPHWPYVVPAPYHDMYGPQDFLPVVRTQAERETDHPVLKGLQNAAASTAFSRDDVRDTVLRGYMGLVKQCDDQMGVLFDWLEETGRMQDTMIVVTSDHGDYLGDHWIGEKMFFHDTSVKVPMIVYDPSSEADATRGTTCDALVESIDLVPTFYQIAGGDPRDIDHIVEGHSLCPILYGETADMPRDASFCEYDYSFTPLAEKLDLHPDDARMVMVATKEWKLVHFEGGFRPVLFDLVNDPQELVDLGQSPDHAGVIARMQDRLFAWTRRQSQRVTRSNKEIYAQRRGPGGLGVLIGVASADETAPENSARYRGHKVADHRERR